jgi:hypothetical protein
MDNERIDREGGAVDLEYSPCRQWAVFILFSIGTAALSIGYSLEAAWQKSEDRFFGLPYSVSICWIVAGTTIGAGTFALARRTLLGALLGLAISGFIAAFATLVTVS